MDKVVMMPGSHEEQVRVFHTPLLQHLACSQFLNGSSVLRGKNDRSASFSKEASVQQEIEDIPSWLKGLMSHQVQRYLNTVTVTEEMLEVPLDKTESMI